MSFLRSGLRLIVAVLFGFFGLRASSQDAVAARISNSKTGPAPTESQPGFNIADLYLAQARLLLEAGQAEQAAKLLDVSLEFLPEYSESLFLYARIYLQRQETYHLALPLLQRAIFSDSWLKTDPVAAAVELARLEVYSGRFREAREIIGQLDAGGAQSGLGGRGSPEISALWARSLIGLGERAAAEAYLKNAVNRYPHSSELRILLARVLARSGKRSEAREVISRGIREMPTSAELVYETATLEPDAGSRLELLDRYFRTGGSDPGAALLALSSRPAEPLSYLQRFFDLGGNQRIAYLDALREYLFSGSDGRLQLLRDRFLREVGAYSGERILDNNGDGLYEEKYSYDRGVLVRWELDENQDGREEARVRFENGRPAEVLVPNPLDRPGGSAAERIAGIEYLYSEYPYLKTVTIVTARSRREYRLLPHQFSQPVFISFPATSSSSVNGQASLRLRVRQDLTRDERIIRESSYQMAEYLPPPGASRPPSVMASLFHFLGGAIVRVDRDPDPRGRFTHTVYLSGSKPVEGWRDLDGDGRHEVRESYRDGRLWRIALDQDGDGREEFIQVFESGSTRSFWDYNNDGRFDSSESSLKAGGSVREFSTRLDGTFDLAYRGETE